MALKSMPIAKLQDLRAQVEAAISEKLQSRRHETATSGEDAVDGQRDGVVLGAQWLPSTATQKIRPRLGQVVASGPGGWWLR
jgi:hypothetical protein